MGCYVVVEFKLRIVISSSEVVKQYYLIVLYDDDDDDDDDDEDEDEVDERIHSTFDPIHRQSNLYIIQ